MISLHNFLMICFQSLPPPRLAECQKTAARIKVLKEEIKNLKLKLAQASVFIYRVSFSLSLLFKLLKAKCRYIWIGIIKDFLFYMQEAFDDADLNIHTFRLSFSR